jgi:hypothetical protein
LAVLRSSVVPQGRTDAMYNFGSIAVTFLLVTPCFLASRCHKQLIIVLTHFQSLQSCVWHASTFWVYGWTIKRVRTKISWLHRVCRSWSVPRREQDENAQLTCFCVHGKCEWTKKLEIINLPTDLLQTWMTQTRLSYLFYWVSPITLLIDSRFCPSRRPLRCLSWGAYEFCQWISILDGR